jgi:hypothetical protein
MPVPQRIVIVLAVLVVAVAGFVVLQPDDDDGGPTATAPAATAPAASGTDADGGATATQPAQPRRAARPRRPSEPRIVVRGGEPVGGIQEIELRKGQTLRFTVVADAVDEVHLHGYDVALPVAPGRPARFGLPADIEGIFEVELHDAGGQIASVTVQP